MAPNIPPVTRPGSGGRSPPTPEYGVGFPPSSKGGQLPAQPNISSPMVVPTILQLLIVDDQTYSQTTPTIWLCSRAVSPIIWNLACDCSAVSPSKRFTMTPNLEDYLACIFHFYVAPHCIARLFANGRRDLPSIRQPITHVALDLEVHRVAVCAPLYGNAKRLTHTATTTISAGQRPHCLHQRCWQVVCRAFLQSHAEAGAAHCPRLRRRDGEPAVTIVERSHHLWRASPPDYRGTKPDVLFWNWHPIYHAATTISAGRVCRIIPNNT